MRRCPSLALVIAALASHGCVAGEVLNTGDARTDARGIDAGAPRDVREADSAEDSRAERASDGASASDVRDAGLADRAAGPDVTIDAGPPLPVSCQRAGAQDCSAFSAMGRCPDGPSAFARDVNAAIDAVIAANPGWFVTAGYPSCCPLIRPANVNDYMQAVTDHLMAANLCASGPGEELGVKFNNACSESWDIVANPDAMTNLVRRHYVGNCFPAFF